MSKKSCESGRSVRQHPTAPARWTSALLLAALGAFVALNLGGCPIEGPQGEQGEQGIQGEQGEQGPAGADGADGQSTQGAPGVPGVPGENGISCWDLNGDGVGDLNEDTNGDGNYDASDCQGEDGQAGENGTNGTNGTNGLACWDLNGNGIGELDEDTNGDGNYDALDCQGEDGEDLTNPDGTPVVQTVTDTTGGLLIVGDVVEITGEELDSVDEVRVGELEATVLTQTAGSLTFQVPAGVTAGANTVRLINFTADTGFVESLAAINVHRLAVMIGRENSKIVVVDSNEHNIVASFDRNVGSPLFPPYTVGFANQGALALVPTGDGYITWIDLTNVHNLASLPDAIELDANDPDSPMPIGIAVSPDGALAVVSDSLRDKLYTLTIDPAANPPVAVAGTYELAVDSSPRAAAFVSDDVLVVPLAGFEVDELLVLGRSGDSIVDVGATPVSAGGVFPGQVKFVSERGVLLCSTLDAFLDPANAALSSFLVGGVNVSNPLNVNVTISGLMAFDVGPHGDFAYAIHNNDDQLRSVLVADSAMADIGVSSDTLTSTQPRTIAVAPSGKFLYVGLVGGDNVDVFEIYSGGTLKRVTSTPLQGNADLARCVGIGFQP